MSSYFDALMRPIGLAPVTHVPSTPQALDPFIEQVAVNPDFADWQVAAPTLPVATPVSSTDLQHAPVAPAPAVSERIDRVEPHGADPARPAQPPATDTRGVVPAQAAVSAAASDEVARANEETRLAAAMRWLAADPAGGRPANSALQELEPIDVGADPSTVRTARLPVATPASPAMLVRSEYDVSSQVMQPAHIPLSPFDRLRISKEAPVKISIGAIHVRVDAPPPTTVQSTAPVTQSPAKAAAGPASARSALSRRALRRI